MRPTRSAKSLSIASGRHPRFERPAVPGAAHLLRSRVHELREVGEDRLREERVGRANGRQVHRAASHRGLLRKDGGVLADAPADRARSRHVQHDDDDHDEQGNADERMREDEPQQQPDEAEDQSRVPAVASAVSASAGVAAATTDARKAVPVAARAVQKATTAAASASPEDPRRVGDLVEVRSVSRASARAGWRRSARSRERGRLASAAAKDLPRAPSGHRPMRLRAHALRARESGTSATRSSSKER